MDIKFISARFPVLQIIMIKSCSCMLGQLHVIFFVVSFGYDNKLMDIMEG